MTTNHNPQQNPHHNPRHKRYGIKKRKSSSKKASSVPVRLIFLGGVGEIGKNMLALEFEDDIMIVDAGVKFPEEELLGIDLVIPDFTYLLDNRDKVRGICLTHGHEDHTGALPFLLKELNIPVYGTRLTLGLVKNKLNEHGLLRTAQLHEINVDESLQLGKFTVEFFRVNHSIPDGVGLAIRTPAGLIVHSGDFKLDQTPIDENVIEYAKLTRYGEEGVLAFICDSTNVERPGHTPSERTIGDSYTHIFTQAKSRIIIATFASNVHRIQQALDNAIRYDRKVAVIGRSMVNTVDVAQSLGYLHMPEGLLIDSEEIDNYPDHKLVILTTGSQGEPMAALTRMAAKNHKQINIRTGDTVVISATPIPGNEKLVARTINNLYKCGANVVHKDSTTVHVSGHAAQEEIKIMLNLLKPKFVIPFHGEYRHQCIFAKLAEQLGITKDRVFIANLGDKIQLAPNSMTMGGRIKVADVFVDGLGVGDVGNIVLRDRHVLANEGVVIAVVTFDKQTGQVVAGPDLISRGFVFVRDANLLINEARERVKDGLVRFEGKKITDWAIIKSTIKETLTQYLFEQTQRRPLVLPIIMEI